MWITEKACGSCEKERQFIRTGRQEKTPVGWKGPGYESSAMPFGLRCVAGCPIV
jgi:hypothetical protein